MRNLIVLGGGEDQIPAYREGRRLGYRVIGVDQRPDALGAAEADHFLCMTSRDPEGIAQALGPIDVAAVISPASDAAQEAVAELSRFYRTAHQPAPDALRCSVDKGFFRDVVGRLGLPTYRHAQHDSIDELTEAAARLGYPLIVKPADSSGSKGITVLDGPAGLVGAIEHAWKYSFSRQVIVEELVAGRHCAVESFFADGELAFMAVTDRVITGPPAMISLSHIVPADLDDDVHARLSDAVSAICAAVGHRQGPVNFDFVLTPGGDICFIEMGARLGGNGMPLMVQHAFGLNTVEAAIRLALGEPLRISVSRRRTAVLRILAADVDGVLTAIEGLDELRRMPEVVDVQVFKTVGEHVRAYTQAGNKLGYLVMVADTREQLESALDEALRTLRFVIEPDTRGSE
ncbi:ATP-grasp domain-containing protein [Nonomuraea guangzhouensis]|uniref:ATP-grasp domain-containing protein n=1 Tax=Nonomuraea guangzhouensis TaxID=1291555 RepID=A0ABW4G725_9ACTN|nr:ATP-grasp domain-containing protein [Nonomuraea guangzhouensis]